MALRDKDDVFRRTLARRGLVDRPTLAARLATMNVDPKVRAAALGRIRADFSAD